MPPSTAEKPNQQAAHQTIKEIAAGRGDIVISHHAKERMQERGFLMQDVLHILKTGRLTRQELHEPSHTWRHTIQGNDLDGDSGTVVTVIIHQARLVVVTVFLKGGKHHGSMHHLRRQNQHNATALPV